MARAECRHDPRIQVDLMVKTATIDPVPDRVTQRRAYQVCDDDRIADISRRGVRLLSTQPPEPGTRVLLQLSLSLDLRPLDLIGKVRWTRVELDPPATTPTIADVGIEVVGGSDSALNRFDEAYAALILGQRQSVATTQTLG